MARLDDFVPERQQAILASIATVPTTEARLRMLARGLGVSLAEIARSTGIPHSRIERTLNGRARGRPDDLKAIAKVLGLEAA